MPLKATECEICVWSTERRYPNSLYYRYYIQVRSFFLLEHHKQVHSPWLSCTGRDSLPLTNHNWPLKSHQQIGAPAIWKMPTWLLCIDIYSNIFLKHSPMLFTHVFSGEELLLVLLTLSSLSTQPPFHGRWERLSASKIKTLEMSLSGTQCNPTRHFLNSIKMDWRTHDLTWLIMWQPFKWPNSPALGETKAPKGSLQLKNNIMPYIASEKKNSFIVLRESIN